MASLRSLVLRPQQLRASFLTQAVAPIQSCLLPAAASRFSTSASSSAAVASPQLKPQSKQATSSVTGKPSSSKRKKRPYPERITKIKPISTNDQPATWATIPPKIPQIPSPTPFIPDVETFLTVIGRGLKQHVSKFPTWESLFSLSSQQMRDLGVEPPRTRKYLLRWRQRFRMGLYGIGGDLQHVKDGQAELRVLEVDLDGDIRKRRRFVVNVPEGVRVEDVVGTEKAAESMSRVRGYKVEGLKTIVGPYALPLRNGVGSRVTVTEGMWENRVGRKIDGGERRRTQVRYKKRILERRQARERAMAQN